MIQISIELPCSIIFVEYIISSEDRFSQIKKIHSEYKQMAPSIYLLAPITYSVAPIRTGD